MVAKCQQQLVHLTINDLCLLGSGPTCSCQQLTSTSVSVSCSVIYADHPVSPINAIMNWTVDGQFYTTNKPTRTLITPYVWNSTSTVTVPFSDSSTFDCTTTFAAPQFASPPYLQTNVPDFSATCTGESVKCWRRRATKISLL